MAFDYLWCRRAIKVVELMKPSTLVAFNNCFGIRFISNVNELILFTLHLGSDHGLARQLFKRLETEGASSLEYTFCN